MQKFLIIFLLFFITGCEDKDSSSDTEYKIYSIINQTDCTLELYSHHDYFEPFSIQPNSVLYNFNWPGHSTDGAYYVWSINHLGWNYNEEQCLYFDLEHKSRALLVTNTPPDN